MEIGNGKISRAKLQFEMKPNLLARDIQLSLRFLFLSTSVIGILLSRIVVLFTQSNSSDSVKRGTLLEFMLYFMEMFNINC
jgi:hypothetical protein